MQIDLDKLKETATLFLYLNIQPTKIPGIVQHPIFNSDTVLIDNKLLNIFTDKETVMNSYKARINAITSIDEFFYIIRKSYYLTFLKFTKPYLSAQDFSYLLGEAWTREEAPNDDVNVSVSLSTKWFKSADKQSLMTKEEYQTYLQLPETLTVYRGVTSGHNPDGLSWTTSLEKAKWFANRFGEGYVRQGTANRSDILAYFSRRGEEEIVVSPKSLQDLVTL